MGFFSPTPSSNTPANTTSSSISDDKDEIIRRLTRDVAEGRERNSQLEESYRAAVGGRKGAVDRVRELEDILRTKEGVFETQEKQIDNLERQNAALSLKEQELFALRLDQVERPLSGSDAYHRFEQLAEVFSSLKDTLSCPVCYEPFERDKAVSMSCGHTFCADCYKSWEARHVDAWKISPQQGAYPGPECPECRVPDPRRGKVRIWALEEVIRLVDRAQRDIANTPYTPAVPPLAPLNSCLPNAPVEPTQVQATLPMLEKEEEVRAEEIVEAQVVWAEEASTHGRGEEADELEWDMPIDQPSQSPTSPPLSAPAALWQDPLNALSPSATFSPDPAGGSALPASATTHQTIDSTTTVADLPAIPALVLERERKPYGLSGSGQLAAR
ncbi:hypothetical protein JCM11641_004811 [Rhodosporidiobolus odoratus]